MSYNSLFGLGTHSADADLLQYYLMDDNAASTTIADSSGNSSDGTAGANTNTFQGSSPGIAGLTGSLAFNTASAGITFSKPAIIINGANGFTCLWRHKYVQGDQRGDDEVWIGPRHVVRKSNGDGAPGLEGLTFSSNGQPTITTSTVVSASWQTWAWVVKSSQFEVYIDGVEDANSPSVGTASGGDRDLDMLDPGGIDSCSGDFAAMALFSRDLSFAETEEYRLGPEPLNLTAPTVSGTHESGQTITSSDGTWDSQANGTLAYTYQWQTATDASGTGLANISGATSSSYTLTASEVGLYVRCLVASSNDGGNDSAEDTGSTWTLVTSGGPGPTFQPAWAMNATVIIQQGLQ